MAMAAAEFRRSSAPVRRRRSSVATTTTSDRRRRGRRAFTLVEVIVVVIIIGVLAGLIAPRIISRIGGARASRAASDMSVLRSQLTIFVGETGYVLQSGDTLKALLWTRPNSVAESAWQGPYLNSEDDFLDPWGNPYVLRVPGTKNVDFDIVSYGADGQAGGEGEAADIVE